MSSSSKRYASLQVDTEQLRDHVQQLYRRYRAIHIYAFAYGEQRRQLDATLAQIAELPRQQLEVLQEDVEAELGRLAVEYEIDNVDEIEKTLADGLSDPTQRGTVVFVRVDFYRRLMPGLARKLRNFHSLPPHASVSIDALPNTKATPRGEVFLLEASLFEDMTALYNDVVDAPAFETLAEAYDDQVSFKRKRALQRATIRAAFAVLEGYLNGLASDIMSDQQEKLSQSQWTQLMEWDTEAKKRKTLSLRDKILQYPKIATGAKHPPLDDRKSREVRDVLKFERLQRHAVIHPTPQWNHANPTAIDRESVHHQVEVEAVTEVCDAIVGLIRRIDSVLGHRFGDVAWWLVDRDEGGRYPPNTFS